MRKITIYLTLVLFTILLLSCSSDYQEISGSEFVEKVLPNVDVQSIEVKNQEEILISTDQEHYKIELNSGSSIQEYLNIIRSYDDNFNETYTASEGFRPSLFLYQFFIALFPLLILLHIILLWIVLRKIIRSGVESVEKLIYTMIVIFVPFMGPIIYLTTKRRSGSNCSKLS